MKLRVSIIAYCIITWYPVCLAQPEAPAPHMLTFFFKPLTTPKTKAINPEAYQRFLKTPGNISRAFITQEIIAPLVYGIFVTYRGLVAHSDFNGQVSFPLRTDPETLTLVITENIKPILLFSNTVHHLEVAEDTPTAFYQYTRTKNDKNITWEVKKTPAPKKNRIPDDALVIVAQPTDIMIIEGKFIADQSPHYILPTIYVSNSMALDTNAFQFLKVAKFFEPVHKAFARAPDRYATIMTN